jgi:serine/threonine-protein kinase
MNPQSSAELTALLCEGPLLTPSQQGELRDQLLSRFPEPKVLAQQLLQRGWLTPYQLNQVFLGRCGDLILGSYAVLERLGEGGTGQVFKARHLHMNRVVALKIIRKEALTDQDAVGRFRREIHAVSQLDHPNVVHAYDAGPIGANFYLAMEYVEGINLQRLVKETGPLAVAQACAYVRQAAEGLQCVHENGLVHRDIKPSNLLVRDLADAVGRRQRPGAEPGSKPWGTVKILDLGLARLRRPLDNSLTGGLTTNSPVMMGTLDYMAPEQALDFHTVDIRADIYSLGCTFYYLLTGQAPFAGGTPAHIILAHQQKPPVSIQHLRRDLPPGLASVSERMMAKQPADRYQTPRDVVNALSAFTGAVFLPAIASLPNGQVPTALPVLIINENRGPVRLSAWDRLGQWLRLRRNEPAPRLLALPGQGRPRSRARVALIAGSVAFAMLLGLLLFAGVFSGRQVIYLSDLPEDNVKGTFGKNGTFRAQRSNGRVIVQGIPFAKGLALQPQTGSGRTTAEVNYRLNKQYRSFQTKAAINDDGECSPLIFMVLGDGNLLWKSRPVGKPGDVQDCNVSVKNVSVLTLMVTCTSDGWSEYHPSVWVDPALVK